MAHEDRAVVSRGLSVALAVVASVCPALLSTIPAAAAPPIPPSLAVAGLPANAAADPRAGFLGVSCAGTNACVAVGTYTTGAGAVDADVTTTVAGAPYRAVAAPLPAGADPQPDAVLRAVSCPTAQACVAVGSYSTSSGRTLGLTVAIASGTPTVLAAPPVPTGAAADPRVALDSVACSTPTACLAAGTYVTKAGATDAFVSRLAAGTWLAPLTAPLPPGHRANPAATVAGVSCWQPGACVLVGTYVAATGSVQGFVARTSKWSPTSVAQLPAGSAGVASLGGVSCPSAGSCVLTATLKATATATLPAAFKESGATWVFTRLSLPSDAAVASQAATVGAVSCPRAALCLAVGSYRSKSGARVAMTDTLVGAAWRPATVVAPPSGVPTSRVIALGASCTSSRACTEVARVTATAGTLLGATGAAYLPPGPPSGLGVAQGPGRTAILSWSPATVPASGIAGYLVWRAVGAGAPVLLGEATSTTYTDRTGLASHASYTYEVATYADDRQTSPRAVAVLVTYTPASAPRSVRVTAGHQSVTVTWAPPAADGGTAVRQYQLVVVAGSAVERVTVPGTARTATIGNLVSHVAVTVRVAAVTAAGPGAMSAPVGAVPT